VSNGKRKLWPGIIRVGPEYLRYVILVLQQQDIPDAERQIHMRGQDLHLVARHAPGPGPLGISKVSSREANVMGVNAAQANAPSAATAMATMIQGDDVKRARAYSLAQFNISEISWT
jgi:hypothetical protein